MGQRPRGLTKQGLTGRTGPDGISSGKGRFGSIARGPLGQNRGKLLAIKATKGQERPKIGGSALVRAGLAPLRGGPWAKIGGRCWQRRKIGW